MSRRRVVLELALVFAAGANGYAEAAHPAPKTATEVFQQSVSGPERATLRLAESMPEGKYSFAPTNGEFTGVRTFAQLVKHIAVDNYMMGAALLAEKCQSTVASTRMDPMRS